MDDRDLLKEFQILQTEAVDTPLLSLVAPSQSTYPIFIFTRAEKARAFFFSPDRPSLGEAPVFVVPDSNTLPASYYPPSAAIYLLSTAVAVLDATTTAADQALEALYRYFIIDHWIRFAAENYQAPKIWTDDATMVPIIRVFLEKLIAPHRDLADRLVALRDRPKDGILVLNTDHDSIFQSLYEHLHLAGHKVHQINNNTGWVAGKGVDENKCQVMDNLSFAEYLIEHRIGLVYFINFHFMDLDKSGLSRMWILQHLHITGIAVIVDMILDGIHPVFMRYLSSNIHVLALHTTENYRMFQRYGPTTRISKCPQIAPHPSNQTPQSVLTSASLEGLVVTSNSRLYFLKEQGLKTALLYPLFRQLMCREMPLYLTYFIFLHAIATAEQELSREAMFPFIKAIGHASIVFRTLVRYELIAQASRVANKLGIPFRIYGDQDWESLFPQDYQNRYLNKTELIALRNRNVTLDATPSGSFYSQHPVIPLILLGGGSILATAPCPTPEGPEQAVAALLERYYFANGAGIEPGLRRVLKQPGLSREEAEAVKKLFGVSTLTSLVEDVLPNGHSKKWEHIPTETEVFRQLTSSETEFLRYSSRYLLGLVQGSYQKEHPSSEISSYFFQSLSLLVNDQKQYLETMRQECPYLTPWVEAVQGGSLL